MTSLATAIGGMNHWDWCPICRGGLDTGLECDQCGADFMPIYTAFKESLSGGNPGEPKACTPAEERGIVGATGAGQLPDGKPGSTVDSAERRSPDGTERTPSPDESNRHLSSKSTVWMAKNRAYSETCYFGHYATAVAWARGGTVVPVEVQHYTPPALHVPKTDLLAEAVRMIQGYQRAGWLTNPAAGEQASDFIARASHEPPQPAEATECRYCDEVMKERDDYHEWADTLAYDIERLVGVEIGEHSNLNSPWGNAHDAAEYELDKRARKPHEPKPSEATGTRDMEPLVAALIQAVKMERDLFNETSDDYSTEALMLAKERVALCKAALLGISHEPEGVLALVKQKRDEYRSFLDAGKGTWPGSDYIQDETWARWQGAWSVLDSIVSQAERERPCLFDKLVGNPLDGFPSTKSGEQT